MTATPFLNTVNSGNAQLLSTSPLDLATDPISGDLVFAANGDLSLSSGMDGVVQGCRQAMLLVAGEWFLDLDAGIPYFERDGVLAADAILGQKFNDVKTREIFRDALLAVAGVTAVISLTVLFANSPTRTLSIGWQVQTAFGDTSPDTLLFGA